MELYLLSETFEGLPVNYFCAVDKKSLEDLIINEEESNTEVKIIKIDSDIDENFINKAKILTDNGIQVCLNFIEKNNNLFLTKKKSNKINIFDIYPVEFCID